MVTYLLPEGLSQILFHVVFTAAFKVLGHADELLKIYDAVPIFIKFLQCLLYFVIASVETDRANQASKFCLVDLVVIISVKNVERRSHNAKFFAGKLRNFHGHCALWHVDNIGRVFRGKKREGFFFR